MLFLIIKSNYIFLCSIGYLSWKCHSMLRYISLNKTLFLYVSQCHNNRYYNYKFITVHIIKILIIQLNVKILNYIMYVVWDLFLLKYRCKELIRYFIDLFFEKYQKLR